MIHGHNHSTLLGGMRRSVYYPPTGTGRDTYIMTNNGGTGSTFKCQGVPQLGNYMKFGPLNKPYKPCSYTRFQKYVSDGSGRDKYVVSHHGGQYNEEEECGVLLRKFRNTMRDGGWKNNSTGENWRVSKQQSRERAVSEYQRTQTNRLSAPKIRGEKYETQL